MSDKIHTLVERFVGELRAAIAHEILESLENIVVGVTAPTAKPANTKNKTDKKKLDYQRAWRLGRKLKEGIKISPEDQKWHAAYLKRK